MDLNRVSYSRSRYTAFDLLSDVGGLSGMFASIFSVIMIIWNYNALDSYLVSHLFKYRTKDSVENNTIDEPMDGDFKPPKYPYLK